MKISMIKKKDELQVTHLRLCYERENLLSQWIPQIQLVNIAAEVDRQNFAHIYNDTKINGLLGDDEILMELEAGCRRTNRN